MKKHKNYRNLLLVFMLISVSILITGCFATGPTESIAPNRATYDSKEAMRYSATDTNFEQKLIKTARLELEAKNLLEREAEIKELITDHSAYISDSHQQSINNRKFYSFSIRVPNDNFQTLLSDLEGLGELREKYINTNDISKSYIDLQIREKNLSAQEERYRELLDKSETVTEILEIEKELNRVRTEIERIQSQLNYYDNQINLSTIELRIFAPEKLFTNRSLPNTFRQAIQGFINSIHLVIIFVANLIPWLIILTLAIFVLYKIITYMRK